MHYRNLKDFLNTLEQRNLLIKIDRRVDPVLEIAEITDRISKQPYGGKAILFTDTGTQFPVVTNLLGSEARLALALRHDNLEQIGHDIDLIVKLLGHPQKNLFQKIATALQLRKLGRIFPTIKKYKGECQQVIIKDNINLFSLPILQLWPKDGGRFITLPLVHTRDPLTGHRNLGMYRIQVFDKTLTAVHWHRHKTGANHFRKYKQIGQKMPVAIALGGDPVYTYVATAPLPEGIDEYILAGYLRGKPVELVKCITQDIEVPADVDIVIEGYIDPGEEFILEGPFGDHTGFYSKPDYYPKFHVTAITYRKDAIYPATVVGIPPQEDAYLAKATERIFLPMIKNTSLNEIQDWDLPVAGCGHNYTIVQIKKIYPGQGKKVINALWGAGQMMFNKFMIIVDQDVDIHHYPSLINTLLRNFNPKTDLIFSYGPTDVLDHASEEFTYGSKLGIDATVKLPEELNTNNFSDYKPIDYKQIQEYIPEVVDINLKLIEHDLPILILSTKKSGKILDLARKLWNEFDLRWLKIIVFVDKFIPVNDLNIVAWITGNNVAPMRDTIILENTMIIDATSKIKNIDNVKDTFPEIVKMDKATIEKVDNNWYNYGFKEKIKSYSIKFH